MLQRLGGPVGTRRPRARTAACLCHRPADQLVKRSRHASPVRRGSDSVRGGLDPKELTHFFRDEAGVEVTAKGRRLRQILFMWPHRAVFPCFPALLGKGWAPGQGCWEHPPVPSVHSCQRRGIILGVVEPMLLACECLLLRDRNTLHSSSLARSAAPELSELSLPLLWRGYFFFLLYGNKIAKMIVGSPPY